MRKLLIPLVAFALITALQGCKHVAGRCDCDGPTDPCRFVHYPGDPSVNIVPHGVIKAPEQLKELPKQ